MKLWGIRVAYVFGVEVWKSPQSPFLVCIISKRELWLWMDSKSLGLRSCWGFRIKCSCHLPGTWRCFFAAASVNFCRTFKLNTSILSICPLWNSPSRQFFPPNSSFFSSWSLSILNPSNCFNFHWVLLYLQHQYFFIVWEKHFSRKI